jgi:hypothetical protein
MILLATRGAFGRGPLFSFRSCGFCGGCGGRRYMVTDCDGGRIWRICAIGGSGFGAESGAGNGRGFSASASASAIRRL